MRFLATFQLYDFLDTLVSLISAFVLGTLIGAERQYRQRTAGLRTNVLVAVGAAAFVDLAMRLSGNDGAIANQLLMLPPGRYRFASRTATITRSTSFHVF